MSRAVGLIASLIVFGSTLAVAAPPASSQPTKAAFKAVNASTIRVRVNGDSKPGLQLRSLDDAGWRLKLQGQLGLMRLLAIDVTPGTPAQTLSVRVAAGEALFDAQRFQGGHVYRVSSAEGATYVYLQPSATLAAQPKAGPGQIDFAEGERAVADEGSIEPAKKGSL